MGLVVEVEGSGKGWGQNALEMTRTHDQGLGTSACSMQMVFFYTVPWWWSLFPLGSRPY